MSPFLPSGYVRVILILSTSSTEPELGEGSCSKTSNKELQGEEKSSKINIGEANRNWNSGEMKEKVFNFLGFLSVSILKQDWRRVCSVCCPCGLCIPATQ